MAQRYIPRDEAYTVGFDKRNELNSKVLSRIYDKGYDNEADIDFHIASMRDPFDGMFENQGDYGQSSESIERNVKRVKQMIRKHPKTHDPESFEFNKKGNLQFSLRENKPIPKDATPKQRERLEKRPRKKQKKIMYFKKGELNKMRADAKKKKKVGRPKGTAEVNPPAPKKNTRY